MVGEESNRETTRLEGKVGLVADELEARAPSPLTAWRYLMETVQPLWGGAAAV